MHARGPHQMLAPTIQFTTNPPTPPTTPQQDAASSQATQGTIAPEPDSMPPAPPHDHPPQRRAPPGPGRTTTHHTPTPHKNKGPGAHQTAAVPYTTPTLQASQPQTQHQAHPTGRQPTQHQTPPGQHTKKETP